MKSAIAAPSRRNSGLETTDRSASGWMSAMMYESYSAVKRMEIDMFKDATPEQICARYSHAY